MMVWYHNCNITVISLELLSCIQSVRLVMCTSFNSNGESIQWYFTFENNFSFRFYSVLVW